MRTAFNKLAARVAVAAVAGMGVAGVAVPAARADNAIVELVKFESTKCLQPANGSDGAAIVQETCNGSEAQQWSVTQGENNAEYHNEATGYCIDAFGGAANGTRIVQWVCASPTIGNQRWQFGQQVGQTSPDGELQSGIVGSDYGYCIATPGVVNGDAMELYTSTFSSSELWYKQAV